MTDSERDAKCPTCGKADKYVRSPGTCGDPFHDDFLRSRDAKLREIAERHGLVVRFSGTTNHPYDAMGALREACDWQREQDQKEKEK